MSLNAKLAIAAAALLAVWWFADDAGAATTSSPSGPCAAPQTLCKWCQDGSCKTCCTPCSAIPTCSITQTPGDPLPSSPSGGDGPVTDPSQVGTLDAGPIVSPDQL